MNVNTITYRNFRNISSANHPEKHIFQKSLHLVIILHPDAETENRPSPKKNQKLCENNESGMFVTAWMGILDIPSGKLQFANA